MIKTVATNRYEKELKLMIKRGKDLNLFWVYSPLLAA
jgi:hypothetical protein